MGYWVAEESVPFQEIADVIGCRLNVPVVSKAPKEAADHFGCSRTLQRWISPPRVSEHGNCWDGNRSKPD
jgi:hypothetical protein